MKAVVFDTHAYVKRLVSVGMPEAQAEVIADEQRALIDDKLATKQDLKELETRFDTRLIELEHRLTLRLGGMMVTAVIVVAALVKLL